MLPRPQTEQEVIEDPIRVLIVDDSAVMRGLLNRILRVSPACEVVASASNGENAISKLQRNDVDVILLDIEMPVMDGLTAIPLLLETCPMVKIIMVSTLTTHDAEIGIEALERGAHDYIGKPSSNRDLAEGSDFAGELVRKIIGLGREARRGEMCRSEARRADVSVRQEDRLRPAAVPSGTPPQSASLYKGKEIVLRSGPMIPPKAIAIGSSTGGPKALTEVLASVDDAVMQPIFITQHMPPTFTTMLSQHLSKASNRPCQEGVDGMAILPGNIYLAPGGYHMTVQGTPLAPTIALNQEPPENFCRPAVDPMLRSIEAVYGAQLLVVILTGMGSDGQIGCTSLAEAGATILAQDEATSTVWGMPGAVATSGLCNEVLPLSEIGKRISEIATGKRP